MKTIIHNDMTQRIEVDISENGDVTLSIGYVEHDEDRFTFTDPEKLREFIDELKLKHDVMKFKKVTN